MSGKLLCRIGPVAVLMEFPERYSSAILGNFLNAERLPLDTRPDLHFVLQHDGKNSDCKFEFAAGKHFQFWPSGFCFSGQYFKATVSGLFDLERTCRVDAFVKEGKNTKRFLLSFLRVMKALFLQGRIILPNSTEKIGSSVMSYSLFWFVMHCVLFKKEQVSFTHQH